MNTYPQTLYKVKKTKSGSDEISQGQYRGYPSKCSLGQVQTKVEQKECTLVLQGKTSRKEE